MAFLSVIISRGIAEVLPTIPKSVMLKILKLLNRNPIARDIELTMFAVTPEKSIFQILNKRGIQCVLFVGEDGSQERGKSRIISRPILILTLASLFLPHSLWYMVSVDHNFAFYGFALVAVCWVLIRQDRYLFSVLYSSTSLQFPSDVFLFLAIINFVLQLIVIRTQSRYLKGLASKTIVLIIILVTLAISFWSDGFAYVLFQIGSSGAVPFPIFYILNIVYVFWQREPKMD